MWFSTKKEAIKRYNNDLLPCQGLGKLSEFPLIYKPGSVNKSYSASLSARHMLSYYWMCIVNDIYQTGTGISNRT